MEVEITHVYEVVEDFRRKIRDQVLETTVRKDSARNTLYGETKLAF